MSGPDKPEDDNAYDVQTLITAGALFLGLCLVIFFLPSIMSAVGGENVWAAGAIIALILVVPFVGLWLRGRMKRKP